MVRNVYKNADATQAMTAFDSEGWMRTVGYGATAKSVELRGIEVAVDSAT